MLESRISWSTPGFYTAQRFGKQQPDLFSSRFYLVITLVELEWFIILVKTWTSITFLGDILTITFCACNAVWVTTIHNTQENYWKGWNYTTIKSKSAVSGVTAGKCTHILFDITCICHENKCNHIYIFRWSRLPLYLIKKQKTTQNPQFFNIQRKQEVYSSGRQKF